MKRRRLGRTGHLSTLVVLGTAAFGEIDQEGANAALDLALAYGVNHIDVAPQYGLAQERLGPWLESRRDLFFVGCKTLERAHDGAWADLQQSLKLLRTDRVDLYQLHAVCTPGDLDEVLAPGGAIETLVRARDEGLTRFLGITGHGMQAPAVHAAALERFEFDTVMLPLYPAMYANASYRRDMVQLLDVAQQRDVGIIIIKAAAKGPWKDGHKLYNTWYEPFVSRREIERGVRFALSQPVTAIASSGDVRLLPMILESAESFSPMSAAEQAQAVSEMADNELIF